jgi:hypothetical protein
MWSCIPIKRSLDVTQWHHLLGDRLKPFGHTALRCLLVQVNAILLLRSLRAARGTRLANESTSGARSALLLQDATRSVSSSST